MISIQYVVLSCMPWDGGVVLGGIFVTGCTGCCLFDSFLCILWWGLVRMMTYFRVSPYTHCKTWTHVRAHNGFLYPSKRAELSRCWVGIGTMPTASFQFRFGASAFLACLLGWYSRVYIPYCCIGICCLWLYVHIDISGGWVRWLRGGCRLHQGLS